MSMNSSPNSERFHIGIFGCINAGKSSLINAITAQDIAMVSPVRGTTTDPVNKAMELLPLGPVLFTDTPGLDDESELADKRREKTVEVLSRSDLAILVVDASKGLCKSDEEILSLFKKENCPYLTVFNKTDLIDVVPDNTKERIYVSAVSGKGIGELKNAIAGFGAGSEPSFPIVADLIKENDTVVLVVPIDASAPKGRLILPQQQTIREVIEAGAFALTVRDTQLKGLMDRLDEARITPSLVITDSQAFKTVAGIVREDMRLTSFSILMARHKGILKASVEGIKAIQKLKVGDKVIISEGCTHHRMCEDIGTKKIPAAIKKLSGCEPEYVFTSGTSFAGSQEVEQASCVVHCGGCMLNEKEMKRRYALCKRAGVPATNYGLVLATAQGILSRSLDFITYE